MNRSPRHRSRSHGLVTAFAHPSTDGLTNPPLPPFHWRTQSFSNEASGYTYSLHLPHPSSVAEGRVSWPNGSLRYGYQ
jgi:hypothetical protein